MAQTGYTPIILFHSTTASNVPTTSNLAVGELALNNTDGKLYYNTGSAIAILAGAGGAGIAGGSNTQVQYNSSGSLAGSANMTFSGTALTLANDASISGLTVGQGALAGTGNTAFGITALSTNSSGGFNTAIGQNALKLSTSGGNSVAVGYGSLSANTTGSLNVAAGVNSLVANTTGGSNTALGTQALQANTTASNNTAVGYQAGYSTTTGTPNTYIGCQAGYGNITGGRNVGLGYKTLFVTENNDNTAIGYQALTANLGGQNTALGSSALQSNTTAANNTAVGYQAGYSNATGAGAAYFGQGAGYTTTGSYNTYIGQNAGGLTTTGTLSTFVGNGAGYNITTGSKNTIIGTFTGNQGGLDIRTASNYIVLSDGDGNPRQIINGSGITGFGAVPATWGAVPVVAVQVNGLGLANNVGSSYIMHNANMQSGYAPYYTNSGYASGIYFNGGGVGGIQTYTTASGTAGNAITFTAGPYVANLGTSWTNSSDERLKNITGEITNALDKVLQLRAATYTWKADESAKPQVGLIAQDLLKVLPEVVVVPESETDKDGNKQYMGVNYDNVIPLLVAAIQELKAEVDILKQQLGK